MKIKKWKLLKRRTAFSSKFVKVYQDKVRLPNGIVLNDYTVVEKPNYVEIVATDKRNRVVTIEEYRHGTKRMELGLPAGFKELGESPVDAARRELHEETGFVGGRFKYIGNLCGYPSKDMHKVYIVRVTGLEIRGKQKLETTEVIKVTLIPVSKLKKQILENKWEDSSSIAALAVSGLLS